MSKSLKATIIIICVLAVFLVTLLLLYDFEPKSGETVTVRVEGESVYAFSERNSEIERVKVVATLKESGKVAREMEYEGVKLSDLIDFATGEKSVGSIVVTAYDGVQKAYSFAELDDLYLVFYENGERLLGKSEKGYGPYMIISTSSVFSQSWCKYVSEIDLRR